MNRIKLALEEYIGRTQIQPRRECRRTTSYSRPTAFFVLSSRRTLNRRCGDSASTKQQVVIKNVLCTSFLVVAKQATYNQEYHLGNTRDCRLAACACFKRCLRSCARSMGSSWESARLCGMLFFPLAPLEGRPPWGSSSSAAT